jgi:hypothetical protein
VIIRERGRKEEKRRGGGGPVKGNDVVVNPPFVLRLGIYRLRPGLVVVVTHRKKKPRVGSVVVRAGDGQQTAEVQRNGTSFRQALP